MSRKQVLNGRPASSQNYAKPIKGTKQNEVYDGYGLDPKIIQLKKKYQLEKSPQYPSYLGHRPTSSLRQQEVLKKLQNIKSQLQAIPDWQQFAKSILFDESNNGDKSRPFVTESKRDSFSYGSKQMFQTRLERQQHCQESKVLENSNISFKINHTTSIEKLPEKTRYSAKEAEVTITPNRTVSEFKYDKYRDYDNKNERVDEKINQISRKIKQSDLKKRNLGVEFVPFEKKTSQLKFDGLQSNFKSRTPQCFNKKNSTSIQKLYARPPKPVSKFTDNSVSFIGIKEQLQTHSPRFAPLYDTKQQSKQQPSFFHKSKPSLDMDIRPKPTPQAYKVQKNRSYSVHENLPYHVPNSFQRHETDTWQNFNNREIVRKAQEALKQRRKKVDNVEQKKKIKQNTQKLVQAFCEQVKLDEKFRNCKLWFKAYKNDKKIGRLKEMLQIEGFRMDEQKILQQFEVQQKQDNPFFSVSSQGYDIEQVARSYICCQKNWQKNLYKRFNKNALENEDFSSMSIDLDKKGYIVLEDLVRFLNMETGTFFRNRDLFTIFKRMSNNSERLNFSTFINTFYA